MEVRKEPDVIGFLMEKEKSQRTAWRNRAEGGPRKKKGYQKRN